MVFSLGILETLLAKGGVGLGSLSTCIARLNKEVEEFLRLKSWQAGSKDPVMQTWRTVYCLELEALVVEPPSWLVFSEKKDQVPTILYC